MSAADDAAGTLVLANESELARVLARELAAQVDLLPSLRASDEDWEAARERVARGPAASRIVVAIASDPAPGARPLVAQADDEWRARGERALFAWCMAAGAASARCADGGAIAFVIEAPAPLDAAGYAPESGLRDAVVALARSVAIAEGARGVRANAVATPARLTSQPLPALAPPLASFPGALAREVAGAVRMLLSSDAAGVTGRLVPADCGRSW